MRRLSDHGVDWIVWAILASVPAIIFWQSATSLVEQGAAGGGPMQDAALFPRTVASIMVGLLVLQALRLLLGRVRHRSPLQRAAGTPLALAATALFAGYLLVLPYAGFHLATPALSLVLFRLLGIGAIAALAGGVGLSLAIAFVFEGLLNVVLPVGHFGIALFG